MSKFTDSTKYYRLYRLLVVVREATQKAVKSDVAKHGILPRQAAVLVTLINIGREATPRELSENLLRESHSMAEILIRMERRGLVRRIKNPGNGRITIAITEKGKQFAKIINENKSVSHLMSCLTREEQEQLYHCMKKLAEKSLKLMGKDKDSIEKFSYFNPRL